MYTDSMNIGVYGSSAGDSNAEVLAREVGIAIAKAGHTVVTGACNGVPQAAVLGALSVGRESIGFSSYSNQEKHIADGDPVEGFSRLEYIPKDFEHIDDIRTCYKYRNVTSVAFSDAAIFINGRMGTLNEFTNAHDMGKHIGVLKGSGGVSDDVIPLAVEKINKPNGATILFESDPETLILKLTEAYEN